MPLPALGHHVLNVPRVARIRVPQVLQVVLATKWRLERASVAGLILRPLLAEQAFQAPFAAWIGRLPRHPRQ
eukprot:13678118-Alexandrium_andersonii.AAC.1